MSTMYWVGTLICSALLVYLLYALFKPEKF